MIGKYELKGKYVTYIDRDEKMRTGKVIRISGMYVTVRNVLNVKHRVYKDKIVGRQFRKKGIEEIDWNQKKSKL